MRERTRILITFVACLSALIIYAYFIEPAWLETKVYKLRIPIKRFVKIALISDLHLKKIGRLEEKVLASIAQENPDLVLVAGDTIDRVGTLPLARMFFSRISAPLGTWGVLGNWEHWVSFQAESWSREEMGMGILVNDAKKVRDDLEIRGFDDAVVGTPRKIASNAASNFCISIFHSPSFFESNGECPLAFAGHTHGGQVRLPFLKPLWLPKGSGRFVAGWYEEKGKRMYVTRGVGTSVLPLRLFARPELDYFELVPE